MAESEIRTSSTCLATASSGKLRVEISPNNKRYKTVALSDERLAGHQGAGEEQARDNKLGDLEWSDTGYTFYKTQCGMPAHHPIRCVHHKRASILNHAPLHTNASLTLGRRVTVVVLCVIHSFILSSGTVFTSTPQLRHEQGRHVKIVQRWNKVLYICGLLPRQSYLCYRKILRPSSSSLPLCTVMQPCSVKYNMLICKKNSYCTLYACTCISYLIVWNIPMLHHFV